METTKMKKIQELKKEIKKNEEMIEMFETLSLLTPGRERFGRRRQHQMLASIETFGKRVVIQKATLKDMMNK